MAGCKCCEGVSGKDVRVSFCPKCKSRSVGYVFGFGNLFGVMPKMKCRDCGFDSPTFPILIANEMELKAAIEGMKAKRGIRKTGAIRKKVVKKVKKVVGKKVIKKTVKKKVVRRR